MKQNKANILEGTKVYLVGHMEYADGRDWRNKVKRILGKRKIVCFDPYHKPFINEIREDSKARGQLKEEMARGDFDAVAKRMGEVRRDDLRLCDLSDFFIVNIVPEIASWGTAEELVWANRLKKPIFLVVQGGKEKTPLWIMGMLPHKYIYSSIDEALNVIKGIDDGNVTLDNKRWRLLRKEYR